MKVSKSNSYKMLNSIECGSEELCTDVSVDVLDGEHFEGPPGPLEVAGAHQGQDDGGHVVVVEAPGWQFNSFARKQNRAYIYAEIS